MEVEVVRVATLKVVVAHSLVVGYHSQVVVPKEDVVDGSLETFLVEACLLEDAYQMEALGAYQEVVSSSLFEGRRPFVNHGSSLGYYRILVDPGYRPLVVM